NACDVDLAQSTKIRRVAQVTKGSDRALQGVCSESVESLSPAIIKAVSLVKSCFSLLHLKDTRT
ncbi:MAG: hypothetical protein AAFY72_17180, partial [Cyanobacteria bacterium J06649_4]